MTRYARLIFSIALLLAGSSAVWGQSVAVKIPITVRDNLGNSKTMYFGVHPLATYCADTGITLSNFCDPGTIRETGSPPTSPFPDVFDARFSDPRGFNSDCMDQGLEADIRHFTDTTDIDTFQVDFQNSVGYPFTLSWPSYLTYYCDSIRMKDKFGGIFINVNMRTSTSLVVSNSAFNGVLITMYGPHQWLCPPGPPALSLPADASVDLDLNPTLSWTPVAGATQYRLEVSTDSLFRTTFAADDTVNGLSKQISGLVQFTKYFWRVASMNVIGAGDFTAPFRFTTRLFPPGTPALVLPLPNATGVATNPTFKWTKVPFASNYRLQVSTDPAFGTTAYDNGSLTDTVRQVTGLANCAQYYWRVLASNAAGPSAFSSSNSFTVLAATPAVPLQVSPVNGATNAAVNPTTLTWNADFCADSDSLQVDLNDSNATTHAFYGAVTGNSKQLNGLVQNALYYWRLKANNNTAGSSGWSSVFSFTTVLLPPAAPTLIAPPPGVDTVATGATFRWSAVPYAVNYGLQVASSPSFASPIFDDSTLTDTVQQIPPTLVHCVLYYWRVRGLNTSGSGSYTSARTFTVIQAAPSPPSLTKPANDAVNRPEFDTLVWSTGDACSRIFRLQVAKDAGFSQKIFDDTTHLKTKIVGPLDPSTDYYWHVKDSNSSGSSAYSATFHFKSTEETTPSVPNLIYPANGEGNIARNPTLMWDSTFPRAASYRLQVAVDSNFAVLFVNDSTITVPSKQVGPLLIGYTYYWRVNAKNRTGTSEFSPISKFTTLYPPDMPAPIYPYNGASNVSVVTDFQWGVTNLATGYHLQVARDPLLTSLVYNDTTLLVNSTQLPNALFGNRQYCWHVRGKNAVGWGPWSATSCFNTEVTGFAQWKIPLSVSETGPRHDTIYFGVDPLATACIDPSLGEFALPPVQSGDFDARFVGTCLGEGVPVDIVHFTDFGQVDTFRVQFQPGIGSYPFQFSWPMDFIRSICDSMVITDDFGGLVLHERMDLASSAVVSNSSIGEVMIIKWGAKPVPTGVKPVLPEIPRGFVLFQNYPNPFNPSTVVQFSTERASQIRIVIYDVLGREVKELTNSAYFPGVYSMSWDGRNGDGVQVPSGVYYLRMVASGFSDESGKSARFSTSRKMLMLK